VNKIIRSRFFYYERCSKTMICTYPALVFGPYASGCRDEQGSTTDKQTTFATRVVHSFTETLNSSNSLILRISYLFRRFRLNRKNSNQEATPIPRPVILRPRRFFLAARPLRSRPPDASGSTGQGPAKSSPLSHRSEIRMPD